MALLTLLLLLTAPALAAGDPRADARDDAARLLARVLAGEPRVEAVQRAAGSRAAPSREEAESWRRRSRLEALVPRLSADYRHDERNYHVVGLSSGSEVDYLRSTPGDVVSVGLTWDLAGLVLGRRELEAVAASERAAGLRRAAVERATQLYFRRLELRLGLVAAPPESGRARAEAELALEQVTAELDALTGLYHAGSAP